MRLKRFDAGSPFNMSLGTDTQHQEAASRHALRAGQLRRYAAI
jgi:hypothetical protein